jgi:hypothetical protein
VDADELEELGAGACILAKRAGHAARDHRHAPLVHASRRHALMHGVDYDAAPAGLENLCDAVCDLRCQLFLHLETSCVAVDDACELADTHHLVGGQVPDVHSADDGRHVMLAMRLERDIAQHHHLVVAAHLLEGPAQVVGGVTLVAGEPVPVGVDDALGRLQQSFPSRIIASPT